MDEEARVAGPALVTVGLLIGVNPLKSSYCPFKVFVRELVREWPPLATLELALLTTLPVPPLTTLDELTFARTRFADIKFEFAVVPLL
jgi:hypothetical protein